MSLPCRDAPFCSAGAWGEWVASAQTPIRSAAPRPLMEVTDPWVVPSLGRLTLQCPQKHHEARAPLSSGAQSRGSPTPKASARPRTDLSASLPAQCVSSARAPSLPWRRAVSSGKMPSLEFGKGTELGGR